MLLFVIRILLFACKMLFLYYDLLVKFQFNIYKM